MPNIFRYLFGQREEAPSPKWTAEKSAQQEWRRAVFRQTGRDPMPYSTDELYADFDLPPHLSD